MIEASHLSKAYGSVKAVTDVSFQVGRGEVVGFLGPNGAGKSTTLRMLAGFLGPTAGAVRIGGDDLAADPIAARRKIGYMPETSPLYPEMRVGEYLEFRAELKGRPRRARRDHVRETLRLVNIRDMEDVVIGHLSKGYRQRVGLADALLGCPPILILDEPTAGLDPNQIRDVRALIRELGKERAILLSTHILSEIEATCNRALVISRGRLVAAGSIEEIRSLRAGAAVRLVVRGEEKAARAAAKKVKGVSRATSAPGDGPGTIALRVELDRGVDAAATVEEVVAALCAAGIGVRQVVPVGDSLEQVFAELTGGAVA
jgi:ABC-2 type transport system ATP-binding protein